MSVINKLFNARKTYNKIKITNYLKLQAKKYRMNKEQNKQDENKKNALIIKHQNHIQKIICIQKYSRS